jgi:hypothetical protein
LKNLNFLICTAGIIFSSHAFAWGAKGHEIVASVGAAIAFQGTDFWQANQQSLEQLSTVPDRIWKATNSTDEGPLHWFQADAYNQDIGPGALSHFPKSYEAAIKQMGFEVITRNGTAPWRIRQLYQLALNAVKDGDAQLTVTFAGAMAHYIGDLSQPLHVTENYDGARTGNTGIHHFFESENIQDQAAIKQIVFIEAQKLLQDPTFVQQFDGDLYDASFNEIERALLMRDPILQTDSQLGRTGQGANALLEIAIARLSDGAATYAMFLSKIAHDSGTRMDRIQVSILEPQWIRPDFSDSDRPNTTPIPLHISGRDDDCEL